MQICFILQHMFRLFEQQTLMIFHKINSVNKFKQHAWSRMLISNMSPVYDVHIFVTCLSSFFFLHKSICIFDKKQIYWRDIWCIYYSSINMQSIFQSAVDLWLPKTEIHITQKLYTYYILSQCPWSVCFFLQLWFFKRI